MSRLENDRSKEQGPATQVASMKFDFNGKVAIVSGGRSGIGRRVVERLAEFGAIVVSADVAHGVDTGVSDPWLGVRDVKLDVREESSCVDLVSQVVDVAGRLDILVNCAGVVERPVRTIDQDVADWQRIIDINLGGTYRLSKVVAAAMAAAGQRGSIVNVGSVTGLRGFRASNAYGVSKSAVAMLTRTMATDLACRGIRVNAVAPGFIDTPMTAHLEVVGRSTKQDYLRRIPLRRFGSPDEVALPVLMLCSNAASYMTGVVIPVDGGWTAFGGV